MYIQSVAKNGRNYAICNYVIFVFGIPELCLLLLVENGPAVPHLGLGLLFVQHRQQEVHHLIDR